MSSNEMVTAIHWQLPSWVESFIDDWDESFDTDAARMRFAIALADRNVSEGSGGPFGAAVFDQDRQLVAPGMNLVTQVNCSAAHAEVVALSLAQQRLGSFDLSATGQLELVTSVEPCAMCLGAIPWSGVRRVLCGADAAAAEAVGFDEGSKPGNWEQSLIDRGIEVHVGIEASASSDVLRKYAAGGGPIYNPGD